MPKRNATLVIAVQTHSLIIVIVCLSNLINDDSASALALNLKEKINLLENRKLHKCKIEGKRRKKEKKKKRKKQETRTAMKIAEKRKKKKIED